MSDEELGFSGKLVDSSSIPELLKDRRGIWVDQFKRIPLGKALVIEGSPDAQRAEVSARAMLREKKLPPNFRVVRRTVDGIRTTYIVNAKAEP